MEKEPGYSPVSIFAAVCGKAAYFAAKANPTTAPFAVGIETAASAVASGITLNDKEKNIKKNLDIAMDKAWETIDKKFRLSLHTEKYTENCLTELKREVMGKNTSVEEFIRNTEIKGFESSVALVIKGILKKHMATLNRDPEIIWNDEYTENAAKEMASILVVAIKSVFENDDHLRILKAISESEGRILTELHQATDQVLGEIRNIKPISEEAPAIPHCLTPIPPVNEIVGLVGRDDTVKTVRGYLEKNHGTALVNGLGGIGKTAVMRYVCNKLKEEGNYVAWFKWESSLKDGLLLLRDMIGIPKKEKADEAYELVISTIRNRLDGKLYLFIDDLTRRLNDDEITLLNSLPIHVMVTSRFEYEYLKNVPLGVLEKDAAIDMFFKYYQRKRNTKDEDIAWKIIDFVHIHTLLVELLAKAAREEGGTLDKFYNKLLNKGYFMVSDEEIMAEQDKEYETIEQRIIKLYKIANLSEDEKRIMRLFTIFTPEKTIYSKVRDWAGLDRKAMRTLVDLGWLDKGEDGYIIHQIVKDSLSKQVGEVRLDDYGELLDKAIDTDGYLSVTETYEVVRERIVLTEDIASYLWKTYQTNSEKDEKRASDAGVLMNNMALVYSNQGNYKKALEYYNKALAIKEKVLGKEHPSTAKTYNNLAGVYHAQGEYDKALDNYNEALAIIEKVHGKKHPDMATAYNNLSLVFSDKGEYEKALAHLKNALAIRVEVLGKEHPSTAKTYNNLGLVYHAQGEYDKALENYNEALAIVEKVHGKKHPDTATAYNNLSQVFRANGNYEEALTHLTNALAIRVEVLGKEHPLTAMTYYNLGLVYHAQGEYDKALENHNEALATIEKVHGKEHPDTAKIYHGLASVYRAQGKYDKALEYYDNALRVFEEKLGQEHSFTKRTREKIENVKKDMSN